MAKKNRGNRGEAGHGRPARRQLPRALGPTQGTAAFVPPVWLRALQRRGTWFWLALFLGATLRLYLVVGTEGTYDVPVWEKHAKGVHDFGLAEYYRREADFNHPPVTGLLMAGLWSLARAVGVPFRIFLRAPFALLDLGTALLLVRLLRQSPRRYVLAAVYWLCPLSILFSSYHGNTDSAVAFSALLAVVLVSEGREGLAGAALGAGFAIKVPAIIAAPVLFFALPDWRTRLRFVGAFLGTGLALYLPGLVEDPTIVVRNVILYGGLDIQTTAGVKLWGIQNFYPVLFELPTAWHGAIVRLLQGYNALNTPICLLLVTGFAWLRRRESSPRALAGSVGMAFAILYGFTNYWSFQYFAWSVPFLLCVDLRFSLPALALMSAYIYGLYAWLCGDLALRGHWDFMGHPLWPFWLLAIRNYCIALFFVAGCSFLAVAVVKEFRSRRRH